MTEAEFKKKFYILYRELRSIESRMQDRCPIVKSCCGGCNLLRIEIKKIKRLSNECVKEWESLK